MNQIKYGNPGCSHAVWRKAAVIAGRDPDMWRRDGLGHTIRFDDLKSTTSAFGWNIDHAVPRTRGGSDWIDNLQPLNRRANIQFSNTLSRDKPGYDKREHFKCLLRRLGENTKRKQDMRVDVGDVVWARQSPTIQVWRLARVMSASQQKDQIIVRWQDAKYEDDLLFDERLFNFDL